MQRRACKAWGQSLMKRRSRVAETERRPPTHRGKPLETKEKQRETKSLLQHLIKLKKERSAGAGEAAAENRGYGRQFHFSGDGREIRDGRAGPEAFPNGNGGFLGRVVPGVS